MRIKAKKGGADEAEGDLTPMIDMTFQLIAFFMVLINFSQAEQNERIKLPDSVLAKPPEEPPDWPITLHLMSDGNVIYSGASQPLAIDSMKLYLDREVSDAGTSGYKADEVTVIIRADRQTDTGKVQKLIEKCQESNLEKFALRVKEKID